MKTILTAFLILFSLILSSCKKDNPIPPGDQPQISLTLVDTSCTEAWVRQTTNNIQLPAEINLTIRDADSISKDKRFLISTADTLLYVDSLLPNHSYNIQAFIQSSNQPDISSNWLAVSKIDTTSNKVSFMKIY